MTTDPRKGDKIRWTQRVNGRRRQFAGKVQTVHVDRWLVGPGRLHQPVRGDWDALPASGEIVQTSRPRLVAVPS